MKQNIIISLLSLSILLLLACAKYPVDTSHRDIQEIESVWQYVKTYSIWQDKVPSNVFDPDTFFMPEDVLASIHDTLHGNNTYTRYNSNVLLSSNFSGNAYLSSIPASSDSHYQTIVVDSLSLSTVYLHITAFEDWSYGEFKEKAFYLAQFKNILIDLRDNTGGDLRTLDSIMCHFLPVNTPYILATYRNYNDTTRKAETIVNEEWKTKIAALPSLNDKKIIILVDSMSASASEIMAAGLKDGKKTAGSNDSATLIGQKTYGKGMGQIIISRRHLYKRDLIITYLRIKRICNCINADYHRKGIVPDLVVNGEYAQLDSALKRLEPNLRLSKSSQTHSSKSVNTTIPEKTITAHSPFEY